jgi:hypothetical protein
MIEDQILQQLQDRVKFARDNCSRPDLPIKFIGGVWDEEVNAPYLEIVMLTNNPDDKTWGTEKFYAGIFRMLLHWSIDASGAYVPTRLAQQLAGAFVKGDRYGPVKISAMPNLSGPIDGPMETLYAIGIRYESSEN